MSLFVTGTRPGGLILSSVVHSLLNSDKSINRPASDPECLAMFRLADIWTSYNPYRVRKSK